MTDIEPFEPTGIVLPDAPAPTRGQATQIEQARAVAQVAAAIRAAQDIPRVIAHAVAEMENSCAQPGLANSAFFRYSRAGSQITGPSIKLARELARCWGNLDYGLVELDRDDTRGRSEMLAYAIDLQTNTRASTTFIVPHARDTKSGRKAIVDVRDVYENNANHGARRLREQIFAVLPEWFSEEGQRLCYATIENPPKAEPLDKRKAKAIRLFGDLGVTEAQLETKLGRKVGQWLAGDVASLQVIFTSLSRGEVTRDEEFPSADERVTTAELGAPTKTRTSTPADRAAADTPSDELTEAEWAADAAADK